MPDPSQGARVDEWLTPAYGYCLAGVRWLEDRQTAFQHLQVGHNADFGNFLRLDGAFQCSESDEFFYHEPLVHSAMLMARRVEQVLIIGGGDGGAAEEALKWRSTRRVQHIEIDGEVVDACRRHLKSVHRGVLDGVDPRHQLVIGDGAAWLASADARGQYDVLILDLTDPGGPSETLHTTGFYQDCQRALTPGGAMTLHIASPWAHADACAERIAQLRQVFAQVMPFEVPVPMSGGSWLMALCLQAATPALPESRVVHDALAQLDGPPLKVLSDATFARQFLLPPYLLERLRENGSG